jgi:hypothetical protein
LRELGPNKHQEPFAILYGSLGFFAEYESFLILGHILDVEHAT